MPTLEQHRLDHTLAALFSLDIAGRLVISSDLMPILLTGSRAAEFWLGTGCLGRSPHDTDLIATEHDAATLVAAAEAKGTPLLAASSTAPLLHHASQPPYRPGAHHPCALRPPRAARRAPGLLKQTETSHAGAKRVLLLEGLPALDIELAGAARGPDLAASSASYARE